MMDNRKLRVATIILAFLGYILLLSELGTVEAWSLPRCHHPIVALRQINTIELRRKVRPNIQDRKHNKIRIMSCERPSKYESESTKLQLIYETLKLMREVAYSVYGPNLFYADELATFINSMVGVVPDRCVRTNNSEMPSIGKIQSPQQAKMCLFTMARYLNVVKNCVKTNHALIPISRLYRKHGGLKVCFSAVNNVKN